MDTLAATFSSITLVKGANFTVHNLFGLIPKIIMKKVYIIIT